MVLGQTVAAPGGPAAGPPPRAAALATPHTLTIPPHPTPPAPRLPTFLYAMPFSPTKVFLEETSLVARPIIPFPELKLRLQQRMAHLGIKVLAVEEEEFCAIPMGGVLPARPQRVIGVGGTAGMVHPSTGYMVARVLGAAPLVADAIVDQLSSGEGRGVAGGMGGEVGRRRATVCGCVCKSAGLAGSARLGCAAPRPSRPSPRPLLSRAVADKATDLHLPRAPRDDAEAAAMAAAVWRTMWPLQRLRQREFFEFGMEVRWSGGLRGGGVSPCAVVKSGPGLLFSLRQLQPPCCAARRPCCPPAAPHPRPPPPTAGAAEAGPGGDAAVLCRLFLAV